MEGDITTNPPEIGALGVVPELAHAQRFARVLEETAPGRPRRMIPQMAYPRYRTDRLTLTDPCEAGEEVMQPVRPEIPLTTPSMLDGAKMA